MHTLGTAPRSEICLLQAIRFLIFRVIFLPPSYPTSIRTA